MTDKKDKEEDKRTNTERAQDRISICTDCPQFNNFTKQCKVCKCWMPLKVLFKSMECPDDPPRW